MRPRLAHPQLSRPVEGVSIICVNHRCWNDLAAKELEKVKQAEVLMLKARNDDPNWRIK